MVDSIHDEGFSLPRSGIGQRCAWFRFLERILLSSADVHDAADYCKSPLANLLAHRHGRGRLRDRCLYAGWNCGPDPTPKTDMTKVEELLGICRSSAESVDLVLVGLGFNIVSWYDELELQELRHLDDDAAHSLQKVAPANDPVEVGPPTPYRPVIYDRGAARRPQVSDDKAIVVVKGESEVVEANAWELDKTELSIVAPTSPQAKASLGNVIEGHLDTGLIFEIIVLLLVHRQLSFMSVEYVRRSAMSCLQNLGTTASWKKVSRVCCICFDAVCCPDISLGTYSRVDISHDVVVVHHEEGGTVRVRGSMEEGDESQRAESSSVCRALIGVVVGPRSLPLLGKKWLVSILSPWSWQTLVHSYGHSGARFLILARRHYVA